jgi:hypothetical protein
MSEINFTIRQARWYYRDWYWSSKIWNIVAYAQMWS